MRRNSIYALLSSLGIHIAIILAIFLAGVISRPVPADLSPLIVTITSLAEGTATDIRGASAGRKENNTVKEVAKTSLLYKSHTHYQSTEKTPPAAEPDLKKTSIAESAAVEIHDRNTTTEKYITGGPASGGTGTIQSASGQGERYASGATPQYGSNPLPVYPSLARKMGYEGVVMLAAEVLSDGRVGQLVIKRTSGFQILDQSALDAVRKWKFIPARWMGKPVPAWVDVPVKFRLSES